MTGCDLHFGRIDLAAVVTLHFRGTEARQRQGTTGVANRCNTCKRKQVLEKGGQQEVMKHGQILVTFKKIIFFPLPFNPS